MYKQNNTQQTFQTLIAIIHWDPKLLVARANAICEFIFQIVPAWWKN